METTGYIPRMYYSVVAVDVVVERVAVVVWAVVDEID